jgi:pimeloyl-ACP methyl ester carboxylesterase
MNSIFYGLLDNTKAEVHRREPAYISSFPVSVCLETALSTCTRHPVCHQLGLGAVEQALTEGLTYLFGSWKGSKQLDAEKDPMAGFLCDCIVDALCADQGILALQPHNGHGSPMGEVLTRQYTKRQTLGGVSYYVRNAGSHPLLFINATGTPVSVWNRFFADKDHNFKIILPERRGSDLFRGGLQQHVPINADSADLAAILDAESLAHVDVLAWCNGARVAVDLANCWPRQVSSLVLLGPMLKGVQGGPSRMSSFERDLQPLLAAVSREPSLARFLSQIIARQSAPPVWDRWTNAPGIRARTLFAMPAREHADAMIAMLTDPQSLINIARRVGSDESYPMAQALGSLQPRTLLIMGSDDNIVSNELVSSAMKQICHNATFKAVINGSGHYIHDLQYHYFRWLLQEFLEEHHPPRQTARISVEELCHSSLCSGGLDLQHVIS